MFEARPLTTLGRWINPLVFADFALLKRMPQLMRVKAPVLIRGTGRSVTTVLGVGLSMHREVGFLNESKAICAALMPNDDLIGSYHRGPARYRPEAQDASPEVVLAARRIFGGHLRFCGARRVVDSYPEMIFRAGYIRAIFPDARFLFVSRSGAATCTSMRSWSERHGTEVAGESHDWCGFRRSKVAVAHRSFRA